MPCDHFSLQVPASKFEDVVKFLLASLSHLGFKEIIRPVPHVVGLGETSPYFWIASVDCDQLDATTVEALNKHAHVAFTAQNAEQVRQFHEAGLKAGGTCNGAPGLRPQYHAGYYGAFVRDSAGGINWEVVTHAGDDK